MSIPSVYWPIAKLGFSKTRSTRRVFRRIFSNFYRKRIWNILINFWAKDRGLQRGRYVTSNNVHAICSAILLFGAFYWLYYSEYLTALGYGIAELAINMPAIVLTRYLYLITIRRSLADPGTGAAIPRAGEPDVYPDSR